MDPDYMPTLSQAHPETMDFLSRAWCNFAVQALQPERHDEECALVLQEDPIKTDTKSSSMKTNTSKNMDDTDKFVPPWKSNDMKSWIWMQQAMHPELNYNSYFKPRKWLPWKILPFRNIPIKRWIKEIKQKRKEDQRLKRAEVHAAISVAGVAAALAAIAAENSKHGDKNATRDMAVASAAALVAAQCAKVAEAMGAKRDQLRSVIDSAVTGTSASEIVTLTAAAATSIKGASTLKARSEYKNRSNGNNPVLPLEDSNELDFDFKKCRSILAKGAQLNVETEDGRWLLRSVAVILNSESKVVLKMKKPNMLKAFASESESVVFDLHAELYKDSEFRETETCYMIALTTNKGMVKLEMMNDYHSYRMWTMTINHMLMLSTSFTKYELQLNKV